MQIVNKNDGKEINGKMINTPEIGSIKGILQDNPIIKQFDEFFKTTLKLDYILISVKSSTSRFTQTNQYILDRIQVIFGKETKD